MYVQESQFVGRVLSLADVLPHAVLTEAHCLLVLIDAPVPHVVRVLGVVRIHEVELGLDWGTGHRTELFVDFHAIAEAGYFVLAMFFCASATLCLVFAPACTLIVCSRLRLAERAFSLWNSR